MKAVLLLAAIGALVSAAPASADTCFVYDSASRSGPSGLCKPIECKDAGVLQAFKSLDACCGELVKLLSWQNKPTCAAKSAEVFKVAAAKPATPAPAAAPTQPAGGCFIYDSASRSGPSGLCKPVQCKDAGVLQAFKSLDACCGELVKLLSWQNKATCAAKSAEVFKVATAPAAGGGVKFTLKKDSDIKMSDLKMGAAMFHRVCGSVAAVEAECAKTPGCVAFTYEAKPRADGGPQCGYLKTAAKEVVGRQGWDVYVKA